MESRFGDIFDSYATLATTLTERWGALASGAASKAQAGAYDANSAMRDAAAGAALAAEAGWLWTEWIFETAAKWSGLEGGANIASSKAFQSPLPGASLELVEALSKGPGLERIPAAAVTVEPRQLDPGETQFTVRVDGSGFRGGTYVGKVRATRETGESQIVTVWIVVP